MDNPDFSIVVDTKLQKKRKISKITKIKDTDIPSFSDHKFFLNKNYTVPHLKNICKHFKLKMGGNKPELIGRIHDYLSNSFSAVIIQKNVKQYFVKKYLQYAGPALKNRIICKNDTDFFTLERITEIPISNFFSFKENNNVWGFNIVSIYNLFAKNLSKNVLNPYTRENISKDIFIDVKNFIKYTKLLGNNVNIIINNNDTELSSKKRNEIKCLELFQIINELGNYSDYSWFINLSRSALIRFIREIIDIWEYRAELSINAKCQICSPNGNPFRYCDVRHLHTINYIQLQKNALTIINQLITKGVSQEHCNLGASYVLCALTLVNEAAANALPWLYQSVS